MFQVHMNYDHQAHGRLTARAANVMYLGRIVKYGTRNVGVVRRATPVDAGRAVRLTVERTANYPTPDRRKFSLGGLE